MHRPKIGNSIRLAVAGAVLAAGLPGVASAASRDNDTEQLLIAAGFVATPASAAGTGAAGLPTKKLIAQPAGANFNYVYSDPSGCDCVLTGGPAEYSRYQALVVQQKIAQQNADASRDRWFNHYGWRGFGFDDPFYYGPVFVVHHDHDGGGEGHEGGGGEGHGGGGRR